MNFSSFAIDQFEGLHNGARPKMILVTPHAALVMSAGPAYASCVASYASIWRIRDFSADAAVARGTGDSLGIFVKSNGVQEGLEAVELLSSRI